MFHKFMSNIILRKSCFALTALFFLLSSLVPSSHCLAQGVASPAIAMKGITVHPEDPLRFDFIMDAPDAGTSVDELKVESTRMAKYFLASLAIPEDQVWVNLSPYEPDRIIPGALGKTLLGKDMLSLDYLLKQVASSLTDPKQSLGKEFWDRVYARAREELGTTDIPMDTFNKVWIVPQDAVVYEHGNSALVVRRHLKVLMEEDYVALEKGLGAGSYGLDGRSDGDQAKASDLSSRVMKEVIIPAIEKEVNESREFAKLRQIYDAMILAVWYKKNLRESLLGQVYVDRSKLRGIDLADKADIQVIYDNYLGMVKQGVYNYIKEENDPLTHEFVPRKYFAGGIPGVHSRDVTFTSDISQQERGERPKNPYKVTVDLAASTDDRAQARPAFERGEGFSGRKLLVRLKEIGAMRGAIAREKSIKGSGDLPEIAVITDYHGEIRLLLEYIADAISKNVGAKVILEHSKFPQQSIREQLRAQGVDLEKIKLKLYLLGDLLDRGPNGIKVFKATRELVDAGVGRYVTGNHDLWAFLNLMGFHLPVYKGYNLYGHKGSQKLVDAHWNEIPEQERLGWWTDKLAEYNESQKKLQGEIFEGRAKEIRQKFKDEYLRLKDEFTPDEKALWADLVGYYFDSTDVGTGLNAVGNMSAQWWRERLGQVDAKLHEATHRSDEDTRASEIAILTELRTYVETATRTVERRLAEKVGQGEWWWQVFNDINHQNYSSVEWWGKDWSSHEGWGTAIIKELNELAGGKKWTQFNYVYNEDLQALARFYRQNFTLFITDEYGNLYTHGAFPVDEETGEFSFTYKGVLYKDRTVFDGLSLIQQDVRDMNTPLADLHEALTLVNSWYADATTKLKPKNIEKIVKKIGLEKIYTRLGIKTWFMGHNPLNTLYPKGVEFLVRQGELTFGSFDKGLSAKFNDNGGMVHIGTDGIFMRGYDDRQKGKIIDHPNTVLLKMNEDGTTFTEKAWTNDPMSRDNFLDQMDGQLAAEEAYLMADFSERTGEGWHQGGINLDARLLNMQVRRDGKGVVLPASQQPVVNMALEGLSPVIISVVPLKDFAAIE